MPSKNRAYLFITLAKFIEAMLGVFASYHITNRVKFHEPLFVVYITWPNYVIMSLMIGIDRIIFYKKRYLASVLEVVVSLTGFILHMACTICVMYYLPKADYVSPGEEGKTTVKELERFQRSIGAAVSSTILASVYLLDFFLCTDILLMKAGYQLWEEPEYANPLVDLPPNLPFKMVFPWETRLKDESMLKKISGIKKAKADYPKDK